MKLKCKWCVALCAASLSTSALAQSTARPSPTEAGRPALAMEYQSVFSGYQPFQEQKGNVWKEVNKEVADNPGMGPMGAMKDPSGKSIAGMEDKSGKGDMAGMAGMGAMTDKAGMAEKSSKGGMPGMAGHGATAGESSGKSKPMEPAGRAGAAESHGAMVMAKPPTSASTATATEKTAGLVNGTGVIQQIDKANGKVKMTHEPIDALGWPRMTMFFRLKDGALAEQVKEGEKVGFSLEKTGSGYVISRFGKPASGKEADEHMKHDMGKGEKK